MHDVLKDLNGKPGVRGSAVVMSDGVVMAALLSRTCDPDSFTALLSALFNQVRKSLGSLALGDLRRMLVSSSRGRFSATNLGNAWLVAELELEIDPETVDLEIQSAASRLRRQLRVGGKSDSIVPPALPCESPSVTAKPFEARTPLEVLSGTADRVAAPH